MAESGEEHMSAFDIACWVGAVVFAAIVNLWIIKIWVVRMGGANRICPSPPVDLEKENKELTDKYLELLVEKHVRLRYEIENKDKKI